MRSRFSAYLELTKPQIMNLVLVTTALGFFLGGKGIHSFSTLFYLLIGAACVCAGSGVLNHYLERDVDCKMSRTRNRPIPTGTIHAQNAFNFGIVLILIGLIILFYKTNLLTAFLSLLTAFLYILVYTPMKKLSWLNTTIGAIPGAIPPMGGWAAATNNLDSGAWVLFLILFTWQHPHFYAIAWMFKEDYKRGGFKMLPVLEPDGRRTFEQIIAFSFALLIVSLFPTIIGLSGRIYFLGAFLAGTILIMMSLTLARSKSTADAHKLLKATVIYLPMLLLLIIFDTNF